MSEPTPREFERLTASVDKLTAVMEQLPEKLRAEFAETYVRKDVLEPTLKDIRGDIQDLAGDVSNHASYFAWIVRTVGVIIVGALMATILVQTGVVR